jgi:hypothetical protein
MQHGRSRLGLDSLHNSSLPPDTRGLEDRARDANQQIKIKKTLTEKRKGKMFGTVKELMHNVHKGRQPKKK